METLTELKYDITKLDAKIENMQKRIDKMAFDDKTEVGIKFLASTVSYLKELREYKQLEEQGLLLRLPCKVGGMVFKLKQHNYCPIGSGICHKNISCSECRANTPFGIVEGKFMLKELKEIGKTVFLTKAEAEQKLKEMESD